MRKIKEILRLKYECNRSNRAIARSIGISDSTVCRLLDKATKAKISWPVELEEEELENILYSTKSMRKASEIDCQYIYQELKRKNVTLALLWKEYKNANSDGMQYSHFCGLYRRWSRHLNVWMRQTHKAGEKLFVDYAGDTVPIMINGETHEAQIFVAVLGASGFFYVEATMTQTLSDWIGAHVRAFNFFNGVPEIIVPDNCRVAVSKANRYEPDTNPTYNDLANHYGVTIIPARVRSPKDKSVVEGTVGHIERQILAALRDKTFFSLEELNKTFRELAEELNQKPFQKIPGSRLSQFENIERPALKSLPPTQYAFAEWKQAKAGLNYHVELLDNYYSVPYTFVQKDLHIRFTQQSVEIFYKGKRIASHSRSYNKAEYITVNEHMPEKHRRYAEWTPTKIMEEAHKIGEATSEFVKQVIASSLHPIKGYKSCSGILRLEKSYGKARIEAACNRALHIGSYTYKSVVSILEHNLDQKPINQVENTTLPVHANIRGSDYYGSKKC